MSMQLKWFLNNVPSAQAEEVVALVNSFHPVEVTSRRDFEKSQVSSIRLAFEERRHLGNGELKKIFNQHNFDAMTADIKAAIKERFGDKVGFYPIETNYHSPTVF